MKNCYAINFDKESYTMPELIKLLAEHFDIEIYDRKKHVNCNYKKIKSLLYSRLGGIGVKSSKKSRDTKYPKDEIIKIYNANLRKLLFSYSNDNSSFNEFEEVLTELDLYKRKLMKYFSSGEYEDDMKSLQKEYEENPSYYDAYMAIENYKQKIINAFVMKRLNFKIDEDLLAKDIEITYTCDENNPDDVSYEAMLRQQNPLSYIK